MSPSSDILLPVGVLLTIAAGLYLLGDAIMQERRRRKRLREEAQIAERRRVPRRRPRQSGRGSR